MPVSKPHSSLGSDNTGSSGALVDYLGKENIELDKMASKAQNREKEFKIQSRKQQFFDARLNKASHFKVQETIDSNISKLGKNDAKFFAPTINFSKKELTHLAKLATDGKQIDNVWQMNNEEFQRYNDYLKAYATITMDNYAGNFNRQNKGLNNGKDLIYFGKVEHFRKYKGTDSEVINGTAKSGDQKPGLQTHIHIIVSRKDRTQKMKLDPTTKEKLTKRKIGKNSYTVGFDRKNWINQNEKSFDQMFQYQRKENERFEIQNTLRNGNFQDRQKAIEMINQQKQQQNKELEL